MTNTENPSKKDMVLTTGILMILISAFILFIPDIFTSLPTPESFFGYFFFNYVLTITFFVIIILNNIYTGARIFRRPLLNYTIIMLILLEISAFSLNREIPVFEESTTWLGVFLIIQAAVWIVYCFREKIPPLVRSIIIFILATGLLVYLYYAIILVVGYPICLIGGIFFGISWHVFVPLLFAITTVIVLVRESKANRRNLIATITGFCLPLLICAWFVNAWKHRIELINTTQNEQIIDDTDLPAWVEVSCALPTDWISEKILKADLVYRSIHTTDDFFRFNGFSRRFEEIKKHDPLVMVASFMSQMPDFTNDDRIRILESRYDSRHQAQERLWSGKDLVTSNVITNIRLYPEYRIAYTEKILSIRNNSRGFNDSQEAIYTFHLPEASVVTSLSLWINGKEEKGILTTKSKADSAYKTIVGVEVRDPSVIHWQEGNTVSVRVFPCTHEENRRFKIGITSPLKKSSDELIYENIFFSGPSAVNATETIQFDNGEGNADLVLPFEAKLKNGKLNYSGTYNPDWNVRVKAPALKSETFIFNGQSYYITELKKKLEPVTIQKVYLDLNETWTKSEIKDVLELVKGKDAYIADGGITKITEDNLDQVMESSASQKFSLFPFFLLKDPSNSLVITKNPAQSPNLNDLKGSRFATNLTSYLEKGNINRVFILGDTSSPYIKALKELRLLKAEQGSLNDLKDILQKNQFPVYSENDSTATINYAGLEIHKVDSAGTGKAPDHLLRLFNYNKIMRITGQKYFDPELNNDEAIELASTAYCVSPLSSLVVLETKKDYERFGIEENKNSLHNASVKSSGAVPEPHEWCLIILTFITGVFLYRKNKMNKASL